MPIRIKPEHDLGVCTLNYESIEGIVDLVQTEFPNSKYSAEDGVWEIFDENSDEFLSAIQAREKLDSFTIISDVMVGEDRNLKLSFNKEEAKVNFTASLDQERWFEHFILDLKDNILPSTVSQRMMYVYGKSNFLVGFNFFLFSFFVPFIPGTTTDYCRILIQQKPPNPFIESVKANLVSNFIWLVLGAISILIAQWIFRVYGIDINPFN